MNAEQKVIHAELVSKLHADTPDQVDHDPHRLWGIICNFDSALSVRLPQVVSSCKRARR